MFRISHRREQAIRSFYSRASPRSTLEVISRIAFKSNGFHLFEIGVGNTGAFKCGGSRSGQFKTLSTYISQSKNSFIWMRHDLGSQLYSAALEGRQSQSMEEDWVHNLKLRDIRKCGKYPCICACPPRFSSSFPGWGDSLIGKIEIKLCFAQF